MIEMLPWLAWTLSDEPSSPIDRRLLPLLRAVRTEGSLAAATAATGLSYRAAWGLLRDYQRRLGAPLVILERGRGAALAPAGETLLAADAAAQRKLELPMRRLAVAVQGRTRAEAAARPGLILAASHDLALAALREASSRQRNGLVLEVSFMGSLDALEQYAAGKAEVAGFHMPLGLRPDARAPYLRLLRDRRDRLIRFVDREQGLIVGPGNPHQLKTFRDIAGRGLRFVNRQPNSGTRLLVDRLLRDEGIDPVRITGYTTEEFTHAAVAATVASGGAQVGFGLKAAAAKLGLGFVPLVHERYWLVVRAAALRSDATLQLVRLLQSAAFARIVKRLPGYRGAGAGTVVEVAKS